MNQDAMNIFYYKKEQLIEQIMALPFSLPAVILSEGGAARWGLSAYLADMKQKGKLLWVSQVDPNPTQNTLLQTRNAVQGFPVDGIIAIGGGSTIDLAKSISAFHLLPDKESPDLLVQGIVNKCYLANENNALPIVAVPTTAGSGSEVTQWATLWDANRSSRYSLDAPWLKPSQVWIVPQLIASMPPRLALATGLDAACHATEAYWAKASTPISKALAICALQILTSTLKPYLANMQDDVLCEKLCTGSLLAGLAFSTTRTTACHSISYPLTYMFGIEHGFAVALTLDQVANLNRTVCDLSEIFEVFSPYNGIQSWIDSVCAGIVDLRLQTFGVKKENIDILAANSITLGRADNNPAELTVAEAKEILLNVY